MAEIFAKKFGERVSSKRPIASPPALQRNDAVGIATEVAVDRRTVNLGALLALERLNRNSEGFGFVAGKP